MTNIASSENRTMSLIKLPSLLEQQQTIFNQSEQQSNHFIRSFNESFKEDKELYHFYKKEQLIFLVILLILIIVGNSLVLLTLACNKRRKPRMNYFIKHLAYSDLLVGLVSVSVDISWKITLSFNAGNILCKLVKYFQELVIYASTYVLVMLSLDRYDAVINPLNFNTRTNRAKHMVVIAWFLSGLLSVPALFLNQLRIKNDLPQCWIQLSQNEWRLYFTLVSLSLFFIPTLIIFYCYVCIIRTIWFQRRTSSEQITSNDRCVQDECTEAEQFAVKNAKEQLLNKDQLSKTRDQFDASLKDANCKLMEDEQRTEFDDDQFSPNSRGELPNNIHISKPGGLSRFRDRLSLKLNSITHSSMWPDTIDAGDKCVVTAADSFVNGDKLKDKFASFANENNTTTTDTYNLSAIQKQTPNRFPNRPLFNSKSILQKHHSFDHAFEHHSFDRIRINPKLHCIKEQSRPDLTSSLKIDLLNQQKNSCIRLHSQGIIPKARIKTLQMTFVIITVFICCWSPYIIWDLLQVYGYIKRSAASNAISTFIQSLAPLNSAANPLIFCFFSSKEVFQTVKLIWARLCFRASKKKKLDQINNRSLTNTTIRKHNNSSPTTTSVSTTTNTKSTTLSRSKSTEN